MNLNTRFRTYVRDFPAWVEGNPALAVRPKVAMFCTGGSRCERATSDTLAQGFGEVFDLRGGILKYLEEVPPDESLWQGECFVFDVCRSARASPLYEEGVSCPRCAASLTEEQRRRFAERQRQIELARARGERHVFDGGTELV